MSQLSEAEFQYALAEFVTLFNAESREKWTLHKSDFGICAKQSVMVKWRESVVNRQAHIAYNSTYRVPVLWFNIYMRDGTPLTAIEALDLASSSHDNFDLIKNISLNEHPVLGILFHNVHPCNTMKIMDELTGPANYIAKWLSVYGSPIGISVPSALFVPPRAAAVTTTCSSSSSPPLSTSHSSDDGSI